MEDTYNLLDKEWIPVLWRDGHKEGRSDRVGIIAALENAHRIRQIAAANPMDRIAILRFLLALLYWCKPEPPAEKESITSFPADWFAKIKENGDCFNLLGDGKRFYQDRSARRRRPATVLVQEVPAGNNFWHLRHSTDNESGICPPCCALGLLRLPLFAVSGLSGPGEPNLMAGINGAPPIYVAPWGRSLLETLVLNWLPRPDLGLPSWVHPGAPQNPDADVPLLTGLTLLPRRVYLHPPIEAGDPCTECGSTALPLIHTCDYQTAGKIENPRWSDPHAIYLGGGTRKAMRAADLTAAGRFRMDRPWPDLVARLFETRKSAGLLAVGFATNKAKNIDVWERFIEIPADLPSQAAIPELLKNWRLQGWAMEKKLERITRSEAQGAAFVAAIRPHVEASVSDKASGAISGGNEQWEQAASEYTPMMTALARSLSPGVTTSALRRRRQIEYLKPDMRPKPPGKEKSKRRKGETSDLDGTIRQSSDPDEIW